MKDSIFSWHRILALCILLVQVTMMVPAQELYLGRQLGNRYLEQYLDRADMESSQQRWQELADQGMLVALTAWESSQTYLLEQDPQRWQAERDLLEQELAEEREVRLAQWILDKYIQSQSNPKFQQLATELEQRAAQWEFQQTDEAGTLVTTRQVDVADSQEAKEQWLSSNQQLIQQYLDENALSISLLEGQLQELNLDEATGEALAQQAATSYQAYLATEYDLILRSETMDLLGNLLYDRESLRAASAKESADNIALTLIQEAKASTEIAVKELFQDFQDDVAENQLEEGEILVAGDQWAQEFQRQLEEGLAVWDKVEVEFLSHRSQWEQDALETYEAGEEAWLEAFQKLQAARQDWENEIMEEFQRGMEEWSQSQLEQELEIQTAQEELVLSLQEEIQRKEELAVLSANVYNQMRSLLASCYQGVENWYSNWAQKYNKVYSYWKTEDTTKYKSFFSQGTLEGLAETFATNSSGKSEINLEYLSSSDTRKKLESQIKQWKTAYLAKIKNEVEKEILQLKNSIQSSENALHKLQSYGSYDTYTTSKPLVEIRELQRKIVADQNRKNALQALLPELERLNVNLSGDEIASYLAKSSLINIDFDKNLWDSSEILLHQDTGWLVLAEAGFKNLETATNNFLEAVNPTSLEGSSSDLDAEIQRLENTLSYWQDELAVAQALKDYATTTTSSAETAQETLQELEAKQKAFQQAEENYKNAQLLVDEAHSVIQQTMVQLSNIQDELDEAALRVEEVKNQIITLDEVILGLDKEVLESQIIKVLDSLKKSFSPETNQEITALVESFFQQATMEGNYVYTNTIEELLSTAPLAGASPQEEELFRQEARTYLLNGESEAWQEDVQTQEEIQRRQLIRDTYGNFRLEIVNERHNQALDEIKTILANQNIWNCATWSEVSALAANLHDAGSNLHGGAASALDQLIMVMVQNWCLQNPLETGALQSSPETIASGVSSLMDAFTESVDSTEVVLSRSEIQQHITELQTMENSLFDVKETLTFLKSPLFSQFDEELQDKFLDYVVKQMLSQTNSLDQLPVVDGSAFFQQLSDEYVWKEDFFQLSEELQLALDQKLEEITDIQSLNEDLLFLQSVLKLKREDLEKNDFLLSLEELKNGYLHDSTLSDLENLLEKCSGIEDSSLLSERDWESLQQFFVKDGIHSLKIQELQSLGNTLISFLESCSEDPYEILSQDSVQQTEEISSQYLSQIYSLQDLSTIKSSLVEPVEIYQLLGNSAQDLQAEKTGLENQLAQKELQRQSVFNRYDSASIAVHQSLAAYQQRLETLDFVYQSFLQSRMELRIAEEKYQWATRVYLKSMGSDSEQEKYEYSSPLQRYNEMLLVTNRYQKALEILSEMKEQQLQNQEYLFQLESSKTALENVYLMEVILSQALSEVARQEEATRAAELKDDLNVAKLFSSYDSLLSSGDLDASELVAQGINSPTLELIRLSLDENNSYHFELGYETNYVKTGTTIRIDEEGNEVGEDVYEYVNSKKAFAEDLDKQLLESYLTDTTETIVRVDGSIQVTRSEMEVRQWLEEIHAKGDDYLNKLLLASIHLKAYSAIPKEGDESYLDILNDDIFQADQLPTRDIFHGMGIKAIYQDERCKLVADAYDFILSKEGGEEDLARYILYRETNLLDKKSWQQREKDLVEWLALDEIRKDVADKQNRRNRDAAIAFASAAALSVAAAFFQPWLFVAAGAAFIIGIVAADAAASLGAVKDGIYDLMKGNKENALKASESLNILLDNLQEGKETLQKQWEKLNFFYHGNEENVSVAGEESTKQALTVEAIMAAVQKMLNQNQFVSSHEYEGLLTTELLSSLLEQETNGLDGASEEGHSLKVTDVLLQAAQKFNNDYMESGENLSKVAVDIQEKSQIAMTGFYQVLGQSLEISEEDREKLMLLEAQATDESLSTVQRQLAMNEYQVLYQSLYAMDTFTQQQLSNLASCAYGSEGWNNLLYKENVYNSYKSLYNTKVDVASGTEEYTAWLQSVMVQQASAGWEDSALQVIGQSQHQWQLERDLLNRRQGLWEAEVMETLSAGAKSWQRVEEKLNKEYTLWRRSFQKKLEERQGEWEQNYLDFLQKKEAWVQESHRQGLVQGLGQELVTDSEFLSPFNQHDVEEQLAYLSRSMESGISSKTTETVVESLLATSYLDQLICHSSTLASLGRNAGAGIKKNYRSTATLESHLVAQQQVAKTSQLMKDVAGRQAAEYGQELLNQMLSAYLSGIDSQNQSMVDWQQYLARDAGYTVDGSIRRTIVVDATLLNPIKETQYLPMYQQYTPNTPNLRKVEATSSEAALLQLGLAQKELELWGQSILGADGLLEQHLGTAPTTVENPDATGSKSAAFKDMGSGQMGAILVEYYWNNIQARRGMAELSKPGHDKRLFDDRGLSFTAPTLREVSEVAMNIIGSATGQAWWFSYIDDAIFAGIDLGGGYKTAGEIGREVAVKAAGVAIGAGTNWAGNAISDITSTVGRAAATAGLNLASGALSTLSTTTLQSMDFDKIGSGDFFNREMFMSHIGSKSTWASLVAGAASTGVSTYGSGVFGAMGAEANKFYGGAMSLATSAASTAASYGVHVAFNGGDWVGAYEAMGGISVNVASFGALADLVGSGIARSNTTGQNILGKVMDKLDGRGVMLNIGLDGVSASVGSGGIDLSGNLYDLGKRALDKRALESYTAAHGQEKGDAAWNNYVYGDWTQENTSARLASGLDQLELVEQAGFTARTTSNGVGGRLIQLVNSGNSYNSAIALGHESHRDGIIGTAEQQGGETLAATTAHTQMALRMLGDGKAIQMTENLATDITAYKLSQHLGDESIFAGYVAGNYDASGDYWKLMDDGTLVNDGSGWLTDEHGRAIRNKDGKQIGADGLESGLLNILFGGTSGKGYNEFDFSERLLSFNILKNSEFSASYPEGELRGMHNAQWDKTDERALNMDYVMENAGNTIATQVFVQYYDSTVDSIIAGSQGLYLGATVNDVSAVAQNRFNSLYQVKSAFYESAGSFVDDSLGYYISGEYNTEYNGHYKYYNFKHYGFDLGRKGGSGGDDIFAGLSGKVTDKNWNEANGNCIQIEYGYNFEDTFIGTGIYGEYLHLQKDSIFGKDEYVQSDSILGQIGGTGFGQADYYADHLHYDVLTYNHKYSSETTLNMLFGNDFGTTVSSIDNVKKTYNPELYYNNFLDVYHPVK